MLKNHLSRNYKKKLNWDNEWFEYFTKIILTIKCECILAMRYIGGVWNKYILQKYFQKKKTFRKNVCNLSCRTKKKWQNKIDVTMMTKNTCYRWCILTLKFLWYFSHILVSSFAKYQY